MRVIGNIFRGLNKLDPVGIPWAAVALWQTGMLAVAIAAIAQRAAQPLWTLPAGLLAVIPGLYYRWSGHRISPVAAVPAFLAATAALVWLHPVEFDTAPLILAGGLGAVAVHFSVAVCATTAAASAALLISASVTHHIDGV
ncbi:MAG: hypothetical protein J2P17_22960, partial [Mycobacterium sp.]|nr:hypothetical protein [Mycobacterium sp.]